MHWLLDPFHFQFMQRALLGCLFIGFTNGFLSSFIVLRRLALLADALSHSLLPGLAIGAMFFGLAPLGLFSGAVVAAILVGLGGQLISHSSRLKDETAIAALYTVAFALGIVLIKYSKVRVDLSHFLFGNILGLSNEDLWVTYCISFLTILVLVTFHRHFLLTLFDPVIAASQGIRVGVFNYLLISLIVLTMVASLQAVGVVLSLGLLILPGATIYLLSDSFAALTWGGGVLGMLGAAAGLLISYWTNIPSGPAIVLILGVCFCLSYLFGPRYGIISQLIRPQHWHRESLLRWKKEKNGDGNA